MERVYNPFCVFTGIFSAGHYPGTHSDQKAALLEMKSQLSSTLWGPEESWVKESSQWVPGR